MLQLDGRIYFGKFKSNPGGVARNMCESLFKLGHPTHFITALGDDEAGKSIKARIPKECRDSLSVLSGESSAQCIVMFDSKRDCRLAMGDFDIHRCISSEMIIANKEKLRNAPLIVLDGNLSVETMSTILEIADKYKKPVFYEPTDVEISAKPFQTKYGRTIKYITPNLEELKYICSYLNLEIKEESCKITQTAKAAKKLVDYVENVIVTMGSEGVIIARKGLAAEPFSKTGDVEVSVRHYKVKKVEKVVNVNGAGDSLASGLISGILSGANEDLCVSVGITAALAALNTESAVAEKLFDESEEGWKTPAIYETLLFF